MNSSLDGRLLSRRIGDHGQGKTRFRDLYGDRTWMEDMDIVNELGAHLGCVNALRSVC